MTQRFQLGQVSEVLNISPETIKGWSHRGYVVGAGTKDDPAFLGGGGRGMRRSFSTEAIMHIAVANEIITRLKPRDSKLAFEAALAFSHLAARSSGHERQPGLPFHYSLGRSVLIVHESSAEVVLESAIESLFRPGEAISLLVDVSAIFDRVYSMLNQMTGDRNWHPSAVLDAAYPALAEAHQS